MEGMNVASPALPPGFRFHPTDQELIIHYLKRKVSASNLEISLIGDLDIYKFNPWELPGKALFGESEWFFFSPRDRKYPNGARPNRAAASGYWKATGTDKPILTSNGTVCLGVKKALVFYKGRPPKGMKTNWMMLEYRLLDDTHQLYRLKGSMRLDDWVLCRVRQKGDSPISNEETSVSSFDSRFSSPFYNLGSLQGQDLMQKYNFLFDYGYASLESEGEALDQGQVVDYQAEGSPGYSTSAVNSNSQVSSFNEALKSIERVLSVGNLEELMPVPPKKRLHMSTPNSSENANIFQASSPEISTSHLHGFSGFMF